MNEVSKSHRTKGIDATHQEAEKDNPPRKNGVWEGAVSYAWEITTWDLKRSQKTRLDCDAWGTREESLKGGNQRGQMLGSRDSLKGYD